MSAEAPTVHGSAVLTGARAVLIRGPSGSGKSSLALCLIHAARTGLLRFARLVGDDRLHLAACNGQLLVRPAAALAGLIEVRGLGVRKVEYEMRAVVGVVVDLCAGDAERLPSPATAVMEGVTVPRLAIAPDANPLQLLVASIHTL
ncbi:MAG TPA: HPr kinase/phosphatase C-terminal domain-containing protein [Xanthobacteraceae bacterium]|jgi:serine kinase of HPr protein (carbohydrate metabolism regulator)